MTTRMQRSLALLKKQGIIYQRVEYWHSFARKRFDLLGIIDILALDVPETIGVQVCGSDLQPHIRKIKESSTIKPWLECGNQFEIWSWRQFKKKRGGKAKEWRCMVTDVILHGGDIYFEDEYQKET